MNSYEKYMNDLVEKADNPIPEKRVKELLNLSVGGVSLSLDGNCACARLGPNLQEGEAEFVEVDYEERDDGKNRAHRRAIVRAFNLLKARCGGQSLPYNTWDAVDVW